MRKIHYKRERSKLESRQIELQAELDQIQRKMDALDVVWNEIFNGADSVEHPELGSPETPKIETAAEESGVPWEEPVIGFFGNGNGKVGKAIEEATEAFSADFGVKEVEAEIKDNEDHADLNVERATISGKLKKMVADGKLKLTVQGRGRRPSQYRRIK